jgi:small subunit ribosomal protein S20
VAHHASAKKRIRQTLKRRDRNRFLMSTVRTQVKKLRQAVAGGDKEAAQQLLPVAVSGFDRIVSKGVLHRRSASRKISRLVRAVAKMD